MQLNPIMDKFYNSILDFSGLVLSDNIIKNKSDKLGDITIDNKFLTLPYFNNLKNPEGRMIFHLLNENYTNPETTVFEFYKKRLILELNLKLSYIIINLISVASDVQIQQRIKSSKLINLISNIGEVDHVLTENFLNLTKVSKKINSEAFIFDIFLKKNGEINDTPYAAIGKINFILANEIYKSLENKEREYKVYDLKLRKKDLLALNNIFNIIFPDFNDKIKYSEGTDNKIFRYLNILLKTAYIIANRINEISELLEEVKEPSLNLEECKSNLDWINQLEQLYGMSNEIRLIPNQTDISVESHRLKLDESKANINQPIENKQEFTPSNISTQPIQQPAQIVQQPVVQPKQLSPEEIIKGNMMPMMPMASNAMMPMPVGNMMPMMPSTPTYTPSWVVQETMKNSVNMQPNTMPMQQIMTPNGPMMIPMNSGPIYNPNMMPMNYGNMMNMQSSSGLELNPLFMGNRMNNFG
jgi:hypothetical protein